MAQIYKIYFPRQVPHLTCLWKSKQRLTFRFRNFSVSKLLPNLWGFRFRFRKIWFRKKKSRFRFRKIWYRKKSIGIAFGQNFGIVIQWPQVQYFVQTSPDSTCNRIIGTIQIQCGDIKVALEKHKSWMSAMLFVIVINTWDAINLAEIVLSWSALLLWLLH